MAKFDAQKWVEYIKKHKNPVLVTGDGCDNISLNGKKLVEYAAEIAKKLDCPVAATGNTVLYLKKNDELNIKKMWLAELFRYLDEDWVDNLSESRPDLLILIGYHPRIVDGMVSNARRIHTVFLGPGKLSSANRSTDEVPLKDWKSNLENFINAL